MKNALILIFAIVAVTLGAVCIVQSRKLAALKAETASLRADADQLQRELADQHSTQKFLEQQNAELFAQSSQLAAKVQAQLRSNPTDAGGALPTTASTNQSKPGGDKNPFGDFFAKMLEDPETKKVIREQQKLMLDQLYNPLIKQLGLPPDEAARFKDLLADSMLKSTESATSLFSNTNRTEAMNRLSEAQKSFEEQFRGFLGESGYAQYQDYQQTVGERAQLNQFRQQYATGDSALTDQQSELLLALMREEKQAVNATGGFGSSGLSQDAANWQRLTSGEAVDRMLQNQETINKRVYERARAVLSENQLTAFGSFQANQLQMMRMGMSMARKFMSPDNAPGTTPNP